MKCIQLAGIALMLLVFSSCKKDSDDSAAVTVPGYWTGWWSTGSSSTRNNMAVIFREAGTARVLYDYTTDTTTAAFKSEGTYSLTGSTLRFSYNEGANVFIHKSNLSRNMSGTWGHAPSETNGGLFELNKQ